VSPLFFPEKVTTFFLLITVCQLSGVTPIYFPEKTGDPFLLITVSFLDFTRVSPPGALNMPTSKIRLRRRTPLAAAYLGMFIQHVRPTKRGPTKGAGNFLHARNIEIMGTPE